MGSVRDNSVKIEKYPVITLKYMCNFYNIHNHNL